MVFFFFQAEDGIRDDLVTGVQTCALPILRIVSDDRCPASLDPLPQVVGNDPQLGPFLNPPLIARYGSGDELLAARPTVEGLLADRKSVGEGKRGDLGGRRVI